jgi:hypothetical protein
VAQVGVYDPCWSERILDEVTRNLIANLSLPRRRPLRLTLTVPRFAEALQ